MKGPSGWWSGSTLTSLLLLLLLSSSPTTTATSSPSSSTATRASTTPLTCDNLVVDGHKYNLGALAGPHAVVTSEYTPPTHHNTTYTIDVCGPLVRRGEVDRAERCPDGTRVCAIKHRWDPKAGKTTDIDQVIPIVVSGTGDDNKAAVGWEAKRLPRDDDGSATQDGKKEGLRLTLTGETRYQQRAQRAVVEFRCNPDLVGTEGEWESVDEYVPPKKDKEGHDRRREIRIGRRDDEEKKKDGDKKDGDNESESTPEKQLKKDMAALVWEGYKRERDGNGAEMDTLYLTWYTKQVCDAAVDEPVPETSHSSGFFFWLFVIGFLAVASYLIFGSWINYTRYGARGWDLLPHGDMIRDIPYLMRDLIRRILNTLQSTGSRGGYSAV
ncbi:hypothetical protein N657DRAFT_575272 [Parathielavia appendiculata]|uniref:Autophagy-related protein 27 n=1 Tax=Parathielavia appendiculata TaxID=2587402 RepID=A0AAN6Z2G7_9PEZI|nr:hypothetical protein N657DRAFT_575272 [Parathielavia appendiculata]